MMPPTGGTLQSKLNWKQQPCLRDGASTLAVFRFQPFASRVGVDQVIGLRFKYSACLVADLKAAFAAARRQDGCQRNVGGWLPEQRAWFVELSAWPVVREQLTANGYRLVQQEDVAGFSADGPGTAQPASASPGPVHAAKTRLIASGAVELKSKVAVLPAVPAWKQPAADGVWARMPVTELRRMARTGVAGAIGELARRGLAY
jgi:hypothetical protein